MTKTTFRDDEEAIQEVDKLVEDDIFSSKSEFYKFTRDFVIEQLVESYEPVMEDYDQKRDELESLERGALAVAYAEEEIRQHFDYAVAVERILDSERDQDEKLDEIQSITEEYFEQVHPDSLYSQVK